MIHNMNMIILSSLSVNSNLYEQELDYHKQKLDYVPNLNILSSYEYNLSADTAYSSDHMGTPEMNGNTAAYGTHIPPFTQTF